jgi:hypothetical protein
MPRGGRKRGADTHELDKFIVPWLPHMCRVAKRQYGLEAFPVIRHIVKSTWPAIGGKSINAATHRLYRKMKSGRYKTPTFPLDHPLAHWSRYTLRAGSFPPKRR